jgi:hypothetical protein
MRTVLLTVSLSLAALAASCASGASSTCCTTDCNAQSVVEQVQKANAGVSRLTMHCKQADGTAIACASTLADKKGKASDPEDLKAMESGAPIVIEEANGLDVTVPIRNQDGKFKAACGVTFADKGMDRAAAVASAQTIAKAVEAGTAACTCAACCTK